MTQGPQPTGPHAGRAGEKSPGGSRAPAAWSLVRVPPGEPGSGAVSLRVLWAACSEGHVHT